MESVKLSAVGDILLSGTVAELIKNEGAKEPFVFIIDELIKNDILFGNLECPFSNRGSPIKNKCCLYSPSETVKSLKSAGFNVVSLANNHIFDYGYESFEDTISLLKENDISWFGAGKNSDEARTPTILSVNNLSIGFLGYSWDFIGSINATENKFGTAPLSKKPIINDVKKLKEKVDVVIVSLHWCYEREKYPLPSQRKLAHKIINAGANLILGHHPHVLQGVEEYNGGFIVYSLGNFIFPDISYKQYNLIQKPENKENLIFSCRISKNGIEGFEIIPVKANNQFQPVLLKNGNKKIIDLSNGFKSKSYSKFWRNNKIRKDLPDLKYQNHNLISFELQMYRIKLFIKKILKKNYTR